MLLLSETHFFYVESWFSGKPLVKVAMEFSMHMAISEDQE